MLNDFATLLFLAFVGWMLGEFILARIIEYQAKRKIWSQFAERGMKEEDIKEIMRRFIIGNQ